MPLLKAKVGEEAVEQISFTLVFCCNCGVPFMMPEIMRKRLLSEGKNGTFYCPNGHGQHYTVSDTERHKKELQKLEDEKRKLEDERRRIENELTDKLLDAINEKNKAAKMLNRIHKGVCPCCNRTFQNLANHIKTKHPELTKK